MTEDKKLAEIAAKRLKENTRWLQHKEVWGNKKEDNKIPLKSRGISK